MVSIPQYSKIPFISISNSKDKFITFSSYFWSYFGDPDFIRGAASFTRRTCQTVLAEHLLSTVRIIAPILPHLAEDVWQNLPFEHVMEDGSVARFIFELKWPAVNEKWLAMPANDVEFWRVVLEVCKCFLYSCSALPSMCLTITKIFYFS